MVIDQGDCFAVLLDAINRYPRPGAIGFISGGDLRDVDVVHGFAVAVVDLERLPVRRQAGLEMQLVHFQAQAQQGFDDEAVHPAGRAGVPGPAAAAGVGRQGIDVGGDDIGLHFVGLDR